MVLEQERQDGANDVEPDRRESDRDEPVAEAAVGWRPRADNLAYLGGRLAQHAH